MRAIGLHIRVYDSLVAAAHKAINLNLPIFQCFFVHQETRLFIEPSQEDVTAFLAMRSSFKSLYLHGSYWINLAHHHSALTLVERELALAERLSFTHMILHAGAGRNGDKQQAITTIARSLNYIMKKHPTIEIVLENSAHGAQCIGSDLHDFKLILEQLDQPEKVTFCLDTAHAYAYGYNLHTAEEQEQFITLLNELIGLDKITLLHLNDTGEAQGSKVDRHASVGQGNLGDNTLKQLSCHPALRHIPIILELPVVSESEEISMLNKVRSWQGVC